jgi:hypothetical protein
MNNISFNKKMKLDFYLIKILKIKLILNNNNQKNNKNN